MTQYPINSAKYKTRRQLYLYMYFFLMSIVLFRHHRAISQTTTWPLRHVKHGNFFPFFFFMSQTPQNILSVFFLRFGNHDQSGPLYDPMSCAYYFIYLFYYYIIIFRRDGGTQGFLYRGYLRSCKRFTIYFGPRRCRCRSPREV